MSDSAHTGVVSEAPRSDEQKPAEPADSLPKGTPGLAISLTLSQRLNVCCPMQRFVFFVHLSGCLRYRPFEEIDGG